MLSEHALAEHNLLFKQTPFLALTQGCERGERMHTSLLDEVHQPARTRIVPTDDWKAGTPRVAKSIAREYSICDEPPFIHARRLERCALQILISRMYIERVLDVRLSARLIVEFHLNANFLAVLFSEDIHLVRGAASHKHHIGACMPSVRFQYFRQKLFKRKARRPERENCTLH